MYKSRSNFANFVTSATALLFSALSWGQTAFPASGTTTIHVLSDLIEIPVLALKPPFRPVPALLSSDFVIRLDGGPPFNPQDARVEGADPLSLALLVEADSPNSGLLSQGLQAAILGWKPALFGSSDRLSIYVYDCRLIRSLPDEPVDLNMERDKVMRAVSPLAFQAAGHVGKTCAHPPMDNLLDTVINHLSKTTNWKAIVLLVNGEHKGDPKLLEKVQAFAAAEGVTFFAIKYLHDGRFPVSVYSQTEGINLLVSSLGGVTVSSSFDDLGSVTETIITLIQQRYILSFPRPGNGSAGPHRLEITSKIKGVRIVSSAAAAPLFDSTHYSNCTGNELCSKQRPQYGTNNPSKGP